MCAEGILIAGQECSETPATGGHTTDTSGLARWSADGNAAVGCARDMRRRDAQGGREVRRREHASGYMWRGAGMRGACRQLRGRMRSRPTDDLLVERVRQWQPCGRGTDAAHHARSSAAGNVQGGKQTADVCFSAGCGDQMLGGEEECRSQAVRSSGSWFSRFSRLMEVAVEGRRHR